MFELIDNLYIIFRNLRYFIMYFVFIWFFLLYEKKIFFVVNMYCMNKYGLVKIIFVMIYIELFFKYLNDFIIYKLINFG